MQESDFLEIESSLDVKLPAQYRTIMVNYPLVVENSDLYSQSQQVIESNQSLRKDGFFETHWPSQFFAFGDDGCGNYWFLDLRAGAENVYQADHEDAFVPENMEELFFLSNLQEFADYQNQLEAELKAEQSKKPFWKFWV